MYFVDRARLSATFAELVIDCEEDRALRAGPEEITAPCSLRQVPTLEWLVEVDLEAISGRDAVNRMDDPVGVGDLGLKHRRAPEDQGLALHGDLDHAGDRRQVAGILQPPDRAGRPGSVVSDSLSALPLLVRLTRSTIRSRTILVLIPLLLDWRELSEPKARKPHEEQIGIAGELLEKEST